MLDLDATDGPIHGEQEARFFHCYYYYLPLYIFYGRHLLAARLRPPEIPALPIATTTSSSVKSGCSAIIASSHSLCSSSLALLMFFQSGFAAA